MNPKKLTDFGVIRRYCAALRRNGDEPTKLMDLLYAELERRGLVGAMLYYLPVYLHWHEQGHSGEATAALVAVELELIEARLTPAGPARVPRLRAPIRAVPALTEHQNHQDHHHTCDFCAMPKHSTQLVNVESWRTLCEPCADRYIDALPLDAAAER